MNDLAEALDWAKNPGVNGLRNNYPQILAAEIIKLTESNRTAKKSLESIRRKTRHFLTGNLWTVKRDAEEGLAAMVRLEEAEKKINQGAKDGRHYGQACLKGHDLTGCGCGRCLDAAESTPPAADTAKPSPRKP